MRSLLTLLVVCQLVIFAQAQNIWTPLPKNEVVNTMSATFPQLPSHYEVMELDFENLKAQLASAPMEFTAAAKNQPLVLSFPMPNGQMESFAIAESPIMEQGLADKFPHIKTYTAQGVNHPTAIGRLDINEQEFHAYFMDGNQSFFIDPMGSSYLSYYKKDHVLPKNIQHECTHDVNSEGLSNAAIRTSFSIGEELRTYRLAVSATGEYSDYHSNGNNTAEVISAITTAVNRMNMVYERDVAVRLILIADNDQLVFFDAANDPFSNNNAGAMLGENTTTINTIIGSENYDIGHVFATGGAGLASLESVCSDQKARGSTGVFPPTGDFFSIDYVAHEIGHQFGANHTFNNCDGNENFSTGFEPGSGSTIMAYASLCGANNLQFNSDDYFHGYSIIEITNFIDNFGINCATTIATNNTPPTVTLPEGGFYIPISTPFQLTAIADDIDGNMLTYCWEQLNSALNPYPLGMPGGTAPLFRTYDPTDSPTRIFPQLQKIINNNLNSSDEVLPDTTRPLDFICTIRDNNAGGGGIVNDQIAFDATHTAGPFLVTNPNTPQNWEVGQWLAVNWNVANTDNSLVNCQAVNVLLSIDGGFTYPYTLATNTPNDGETFVSVPDALTSTARIRVEAADNIFFDISNTNFTINPPSQPGYSYFLSPSHQEVCLPDEVVIHIETSSLLGYDEPITYTITSALPTGTIANFSANPALPSEGSILTLDMSNVVVSSTFDVTIEATAPGFNPATRTVNVRIISNDYSTFALETPADGEAGVSQLPQLSWYGASAAQNYLIQLSADPSFEVGTILNEAIISDTFFTPGVVLDVNTPYYWRVQPFNECGEAEFSKIQSFHTIGLNCEVYENNTSVNISSSGTPTVESKVMIPTDGMISDLNVRNIKGTHDAIQHLDFTLISPIGTEVILLTGVCGNTSIFNFGLDDEAPTTIACPPTNGNVYLPENPLSAFIGQDASGQWVLQAKVNDTQGNGGALQQFHLQVCSSISLNPPALVKNDTMPVVPGQWRLLTDEFLLVEDPNNTPLELEYTIVEAPAHGQLYFMNNEVHSGDIFRQSSLNAGNVLYVHNGDPEPTDAFTFTVRDGEGGFIGTPQFNIKLDPDAMVNIERVIRENDIQVYPNPNNGQFYIAFDQPVFEPVHLSLVNVQGQLVWEQQTKEVAPNMPLRISGLPAGVYFLQLEMEQGVVVKKVIVE